MPALPSVPSVLMLRHKFTVGTNFDVLCRLFFRYSGTAPAPSDLTSVASAMEAQAVINLIPHLGGDAALTAIEITDLSSPTAAYGEWVGSEAGIRTGIALPPGVAVLNNMEIARRYRGGKPRVYWPFFTSTDIDVSTGLFLAASCTALEADVAGGYVPHMLSQTWAGGAVVQWVNVSYYQGFTVVTNPITGRARNVPTVRAVPVVDGISASSVNVKPGSQRRRNQHSS